MSDRGRGRPPGTTHDDIRDVALALILEHGYADTSLASIARAAGISRTTLFAYFPSKRDLIWEAHDERTRDLDRALDDGPMTPVVDVILRGLLVPARYSADEHATLAMRRRIVEQDDGLRAYAALAVQEMTDRLAAEVARRVPEADAWTVDLVTRALAAAASRCTDEWAAAEAPTDALDAHVVEGIRPIVEALRSLLP